ncbi:hypothetical protein AOQ84DRAFT_196602 [Glonium stellatum]|uniref:C2H2-type domain-containing protein n=1 Tax=Glonium stellatum TaxID=574774 RepID=A0A8E2F610_9PEZI|nr:hypothetical protein AOQ84DRAFT_196602 [Glonium stellatum]
MSKLPTNIRSAGNGPSAKGGVSVGSNLPYAFRPPFEIGSEVPSPELKGPYLDPGQFQDFRTKYATGLCGQSFYSSPSASHEHRNLSRYPSPRSITRQPDYTANQPEVFDGSHMLLALQKVSHSHPEQDVRAIPQSAPLRQQVNDTSGPRHNESQHLVRCYVKAYQNRCLKSQPKSSVGGRYQCTSGCGYKTKRKDDWRRHEEINHPQDVWICSLCPSPLKSAFLTHRSDKLNGHVKKIHKGANPRIVAKESKVKFDAGFDLRCGFCTDTFETWAQRISHIANHFESGLSIDEWKTLNRRSTQPEKDLGVSDGSNDNSIDQLPHPSKKDALPFEAQEKDASSFSPQATTPQDGLDLRGLPSLPSAERFSLQHARQFDLQAATPATSHTPETNSEYNQAMLRCILHRSLIDLPTFAVSNLETGKSIVPKPGISNSSRPFNTLRSPVDLNLAGFGSHLGCEDPIRHHTQLPESEQSSSPRPRQPLSSQTAASRAAIKRRLGGKEDANPNEDEDENGNPKKPRNSNVQSDGQKGLTLACPYQKHEMEHGLGRTCRGIAVTNPSEMTRHLQSNHHIFIMLCRQCNTHILEKKDWETQHGKNPVCTPQKQARGNARKAQWQALYIKLFPNASRTPSPWNGDDPDQPITRGRTNHEIHAHAPIRPLAADNSLFLSKHPISQPLEVPQMIDEVREDFLGLASQAQIPSTIDGDDPSDQGYAQQETDANYMVIKFKNAFIDFMKSKPASTQGEFTRLVRAYQHECYKDLRLAPWAKDNPLSTITFSEQRTDGGFIDEFVDVTIKLPSSLKCQLAQRLYDYVRGLSDWQPSILPNTPQMSTQTGDSAYESGTSALSPLIYPYGMDENVADDEPQYNSSHFEEQFQPFSGDSGISEP